MFLYYHYLIYYDWLQPANHSNDSHRLLTTTMLPSSNGGKNLENKKQKQKPILLTNLLLLVLFFYIMLGWPRMNYDMAAGWHEIALHFENQHRIVYYYVHVCFVCFYP